MDPAILQMLGKAWEHWLENKEDIPHFGFRDWLWSDYGVRYTRKRFTFSDSHKRLLFWMHWS